MPTAKGGYFLADGTKVPGVTTVLGRWKDSGGLLHWAFEQGQSGAPHLYAARDVAADIGTLAHAMVEEFLRGRDPEAALIAAPESHKAKARRAYDSFQRWRRQNRAEVTSIESPLISEAMRVGGTPDIALRWDGQYMMGDIKTSNGVYTDYLMQVAAYRAMWNETQPEPMTGGFHILRFAKEEADFQHSYWDNLDEALELFKLLRVAYDLDKRLKKRV